MIGTPKCILRKLQRVQNTHAARLLTYTKVSAHITPVLINFALATSSVSHSIQNSLDGL